MRRGSHRINAKLQHLLLVIHICYVPSATRQCDSVSSCVYLEFSSLFFFKSQCQIPSPILLVEQVLSGYTMNPTLSSMDDGSALISLWPPKASTLLITLSFYKYSFLLTVSLFLLCHPHTNSYTSTLNGGSLQRLALCLLFSSLYVPGFSKLVLLKIR